MTKHIHGGNVYQYQNCIDFSANCNPLGTPKRVVQAGEKALQYVFHYPQVGCLKLKEKIGVYEDVPEEFLICGNGAADLIFSLCRALKPKQALLPAPTFAEYEQALDSMDCQVEYYYLQEEQGYLIGEDFLDALHSEIDLVFLCNPNNPTGMLTKRKFLLQVLNRCRELGIFLVVDECFLDFVKEPEAYTLKKELPNYPNLFLLKAFTKRYAMAGLRLGYGLTGNRELLKKMEQMTQPWNVSSVAQAAGIAALKETAYVEEGRELIFKESAYLKRELKRLGLVVFPSQANYIFFRGPVGLFENCVKKGILIRDCSNYPGLEEGFYRIAVKRHAENQMLVQTFGEVLKKKR